MLQPAYPDARHCEIPAECFNMITLARRREGGRLQLRLPDLTDNVMVITADDWRCWNRRLGLLLLSWEGFQNGQRQGLREPVRCTLTLHHSYSRTIIHRIYESLRLHVANHADRRAGNRGANVSTLPGTVQRDADD